MTQTVSGKAFEYQLAVELSKFLNIPFLPTAEKTIGLNCMNAVPEIEATKIQALKFDIKFIGMPQTVARHEILYKLSN